jgi:hypothetical protein
MKSLVKHLILALAFLELPTRVPAQTVAELKASIDSLRAEVVQLRADMGPSGNRTVQEYVASASGTSSGLLGISTPKAGMILFRSNLAHAPTQDGITDSYAGRCDINGWDGGLRCLQNWQIEGTKSLPVGTFGMDSRAAFSYNWWPAELSDHAPSPDNGAFTNDPSSPLYEVYRGQTLIIDGGSQAPTNYLTGGLLSTRRHVLVASQRAGWPIYFAVSPTRPGGYPTNRAVMKLNSDGSQNPVEVVIGGALRRLQSCNIGGVTVVCF